MAGNQVYLLILVNLHSPVFGSESAFRIRIRILDSQINADQQHCYITVQYGTVQYCTRQCVIVNFFEKLRSDTFTFLTKIEKLRIAVLTFGDFSVS